LRDGRNAGTLATHEISHDAMVRMMVGRDLEKFSKPLVLDQSAKVRLELKQFKFIGGTPSGVTFQLKAGEILGMAGLVGAGRTELAETLFGIRPSQGGRAILDGENFLPRSPVDAIAAGLLLVPEDRRHHGLILLQSIKHNLSLPNLKTISRFFLVDPFKEAKLSTDSIQRLGIKTTNANKLAGLLSGGNQQKVVLAKWLAVGPKVLILDEPTRGVDVGAKAEIYELIRHLASLGVAILMISSDMEEVIRLSQRVIVLHEGNLQGELSGNDINEESVMLLATGSKEVNVK
jgi:ribose transport system ATP-binding protein